MTGPYRWVGNSAGTIHAELAGHPVEMVWAALPEPDYLDEDCVTKPVRHARVIAAGAVG